MTDPFDLQRFVDAQAGTYATALDEIRRGAKRGHWMWYVFPQFAGLGRSPTAHRYAIDSTKEGLAYLAHPVLGQRYRECVSALQDLTSTTAKAVFGTVDGMKLHSSLTLFALLSDDPLYDAAIDRWFGAERDLATIRLIDEKSRRSA